MNKSKPVSYKPEFKEQAVKQALSSGESIAHTARYTISCIAGTWRMGK